MSLKPKHISIGIDPAGIGTTGIVIKTFNATFPKNWHTQIKATNPIEAFNLINKYIDEKLNCFSVRDIELKNVICELLHEGKEMFREVKATRELIGLLRYKYKYKFCGHLPKHKDKIFIKNKIEKYGRKNEHWIHAEAIMHAHFSSKEKKLKCEKWNWEVFDYGTKKNR